MSRVEARCVANRSIAPGITAVYWEAGHILGSASIEVRVETEEGLVTLLFSGDLGPGGRDFLPEWRAELRARMPAALDEVLLEIVRARVENLRERGMPVRPETLGLWNALSDGSGLA